MEQQNQSKSRVKDDILACEKYVGADPEYSLRVLISDEAASIIIGKGGHQIRAVRSKSGAWIDLTDHGDSRDRSRTRERIVIINGKISQIAKGIKGLAELLSDSSNNIALDLIIPSLQISHILGTKGRLATKIESNTSTKIKIQKNQLKNSSEQIVTISGKSSNIGDCVFHILYQLYEAPPREKVRHYDPFDRDSIPFRHSDSYGYDRRDSYPLDRDRDPYPLDRDRDPYYGGRAEYYGAPRDRERDDRYRRYDESKEFPSRDRDEARMGHYDRPFYVDEGGYYRSRSPIPFPSSYPSSYPPRVPQNHYQYASHVGYPPERYGSPERRYSIPPDRLRQFNDPRLSQANAPSLLQLDENRLRDLLKSIAPNN